MNKAERIKRYIDRKKPFLSKSEGVGLYGKITVWITDIHGVKRKVFADHNAIQAAYANAIVDALDDTTPDFAIDNMFNGYTQPPTNGEDGIAIKDSGGLWYEMTMATTVRSASTVTFTGTFTGTGITVADANSVNLGRDYATPFNTIIAKPSSWSSQDVLAGETLTIEWILYHQAT